MANSRRCVSIDSTVNSMIRSKLTLEPDIDRHTARYKHLPSPATFPDTVCGTVLSMVINGIVGGDVMLLIIDS